MRDLNQAERWAQYSLSLRSDDDRHGRALSLGALGAVALQRFDSARADGEAAAILEHHLNAARSLYQQSLDLAPADDHHARGIRENQLGLIYDRAADFGQALRHYQRAIQHLEACGDIYLVGIIRYNITTLLAGHGKINDALIYARAALDSFRQVGLGASAKAADTERLIIRLEQAGRQP